MASLAGLDVPLAFLDLKGFLESKSPLREIGGRIVMHFCLLVPCESDDEWYEIVAYDREARICRATEEGEPLFVTVYRPRASELKDGVEHTGMVAFDIDWWFLDDD